MRVEFIDDQVALYLGAPSPSIQDECLYRIGVHVDLIAELPETLTRSITDADRDRVLMWLENHHYRVQHYLTGIILKPITIKSNNGTVVESLQPGTSLRLIKPSVLSQGGKVVSWCALYGNEIFNVAVNEPNGEPILQIQTQ